MSMLAIASVIWCNHGAAARACLAAAALTSQMASKRIALTTTDGRNRWRASSSAAAHAHIHTFVQIVFAKAQWVGTKEENPEEREVPLPPIMALEQGVDDTVKFGTGLAVREDSLIDGAPSPGATPRAQRKKRSRDAAAASSGSEGETDDDMSESDLEVLEAGTGTPVPLRRPSRAAAAKATERCVCNCEQLQVRHSGNDKSQSTNHSRGSCTRCCAPLMHQLQSH